jgi:hypothetical protein
MEGVTGKVPTTRGLPLVLSVCSLLWLAACSDDDDPATVLGSDALAVDWAPQGSVSAFTNLNAKSTSLQLNLAGVTEEHSVQVGANSDSGADPTTIDLVTQSGTPTIQGPPILITQQAFMISHGIRATDETYDTFSQLVTALSKEITSTSPVVDIAATGVYDSKSNTFTANAMAVLIND